MSRVRKSDKRGRSKGTLAPFVAVERYIMKSLAWRSLSPNGRAAYLEVGYGFEGENNGRILLSTQMLADRMGRDKSTAARALRELVCKGFVECVSKGGFSLKLPHASEWRLAAFKCDVTGALATKAFMRWQPENPERGGTGEARGGTGATDSQKATRNSPSQWHGCNREGRLAGVSGGTGATHLSSNHMGSVSESAQRGDAARPVQAPASVNSGPFEPDTFTDIHGAALRSLAELSETLPAHLKSWATQKSAPAQPQKFAIAAE